jgi:C4-dicarboxylate transporter DctM subunit
VALTLFASLFLAMLIEIPIAFALVLSCIIAILCFFPTGNMLLLLGQALITTADSFPLMAIPFFMLVGTLMARSGLSREIIEVGEAFTGDSPGGLGSATIVSCMIFASISGSGPAVVAALGAILIPAMIKRDYDAAYAGAIVASGATIGPVIPPSIPMIVYGVVAGVSVVSMFAGGFIPGIIMGMCLIVMNKRLSKKRGYQGQPREGNWKWVIQKCWNARWALFLPFIILGGIYGGVFTPTEAAVIGCVYALFTGKIIYKQLSLKDIKDAMVEAALLSCIAMFVLGGATTFGRLLTIERIPQALATSMLNISSSPMVIMFLIMGFLIISGMFIDTTSNIVLFAPLFLPIIKKIGVNPVYFGVLMSMNLCIGMITPPVGVNLYVAQGVCKAPFEKIVSESLPFLLALLVSLLLVMLFPELVLFLPRILGSPV